LANVLGLGLDEDFELREVSRVDLDALYGEFSWLVAPGFLTEQSARELLAGNPDYAGLADVARMSRAGVTAARGAFMPSLFSIVDDIRAKCGKLGVGGEAQPTLACSFTDGFAQPERGRPGSGSGPPPFDREDDGETPV
ncbi:MAG: hypothetical protein ABIK85_06990, partial [Candidatus Eisenbacteria bacterium]